MLQDRRNVEDYIGKLYLVKIPLHGDVITYCQFLTTEKLTIYSATKLYKCHMVAENSRFARFTFLHQKFISAGSLVI